MRCGGAAVAVAVALVLAFVACGGGSGGGSKPKPPMPRTDLERFDVKLDQSLEPWRPAFEASMAAMVPKINDYLRQHRPESRPPKVIVATFLGKTHCDRTARRGNWSFQAPVGVEDCAAGRRTFRREGQFGSNGVAFELTMMLMWCNKPKGGYCGGKPDKTGKFDDPVDEGFYRLIQTSPWIGDSPAVP